MPKKIIIPATEDLWDEEHGQFISMKEQTLVIEHSLVSISKWESKWKKPFLSLDEKTPDELIDYVRCMTINQVNENVYAFLSPVILREIDEYISDPMTATTFTDRSQKSRHKEVITSEIIYYQMISFGIPVEFEKWHLNRLMTLIRVFSIKNGGEKKMSRSEAALFQRSINERRLASHRKR